MQIFAIIKELIPNFLKKIFEFNSVHKVILNVISYHKMYNNCVNPNCIGDNNNLIHDTKSCDLICNICGFVVSNIIQESYNYLDSSTNVYNNLLSHKSQISTIISSNKCQSSSKKFKFIKYHKNDVFTHQDRSFIKTFILIENICLNFNLLDNVCINSKTLFKICSQKQINRGFVKKGIIYACIYVVCKNLNSTIDIGILATYENLLPKYIYNGIKYVEQVIFNTSCLENIALVYENDDTIFFNFIFKISSSFSFLSSTQSKINLTSFVNKCKPYISANSILPNHLAGCLIYLFIISFYKNSQIFNKNTKVIISDIIQISYITFNKKIKLVSQSLS